MNRIDRLTAILIQLQTKRVVKAEEVADRFEISLRTVYRDVKALMEAGVPIGSEAGKGYFIVDGYHLPPVMFNQEEAGAMLLAGKLVEKMTDKSVKRAFQSAMHKITAVLKESEKDHLESLNAVVEVHHNQWRRRPELPNHFITDIQKAVTTKEVLKLVYYSSKKETTTREVEPIGLFFYAGAWHLIGWCRMREGYRDFRSDQIKEMELTGRHFDGSNLLSLQEYFKSFEAAHSGLIKVRLSFCKTDRISRPFYGAINERDLGDRIQVEFLMDNLEHAVRWLTHFGSNVEIEEPEALKALMAKRAEELYLHFSKQVSLAQ
ncbi:MAG: YafY family protein [Cyclobacteriaceae bacterium]